LRLLLALLVAVSTAACAQERMLVFAAASLKNALDEANAAYGAPVVASYAASSALACQVERGAPAQVFISADAEWMDYLARKSLLVPSTRRNLLGNRLVWVVPINSAVDALPATGRLALADPQHVPAGKYAKAALEKLGKWNSLEKRIAAAENVRAALALVARGEAPMGIVYETDARAEPKVRIAGRIAPDLHAPIVYPAAVLRGAPPQAQRYLDYLGGAQAAAIFEKHGFHVVR